MLGSNGSILVVDDSVASLKQLTDTLMAEGYQVRSADSGELALASVAASPPDLILLDIRMNGFEVMRRLKGSDSSRTIPVMFISATTDVEDWVDGMKLGAADFIHKPFRPEELLARVRTHLELRQLNVKLEHRAMELKRATDQLEAEMEDRLRAELNLQESEDQFRTLVEASPVSIFIQTNRCFAYVNPAAVALFGAASKDELLGKPVIERFHPDSQMQMRKRIRLLNEERVAVSAVEERCYTLYGDLLCLEISAVPFTYDGHAGALVFASDITGRKKEEELRRKLEQQMLNTQKQECMGVLAGGIAHDFNNILMAVMGNTSLALLRLGPNSPVVENLKQIEQATDKAAKLAQQMLAYSGKGKFIVETLDLSSLVGEMAQMLEVSISKKSILRFNFGNQLPMVHADATQLRQIIMNLVINASEAIGDRSGIIALTTGAIDCDRAYLQNLWFDENLPEGPYVFLEVSDTGCGMDKETAARIFDPFFTTKSVGRGLGMAAVLGIVRGHGGTIKVNSEPGKGSTFKILLPAPQGA